MKWPSGVQWEWALGDFVLLAFLFWELHKLRRSQRRDRERVQQDEAPADTATPSRDSQAPNKPAR